MSQSSTTSRMPLVLCALALVSAGLLGGCSKKTGAGRSPQSVPTQVVLAEARQQPISERLAMVGSLAANEMVEVKAEMDGTVLKVQFEEGKPVNQGDLLIQLDDSKLLASLAEAEANFKLSQITFDRNKQLFAEKLISRQELDQASALFHANEATMQLRRRQLQDTRIFAPFSGVASYRAVSPGQVIAKNTALTWLVDASIVKVELNIPERFLGQIKTGQTIELTVAAFPKEKFRGQVYFIAPQLDPATRTALVKARIQNADLRLKPGMFANLDLTVKTRDDAIVIPESALVRVMQDDRALVYGVTETNTVALRPVKLGLRLPGEVEVLQGLRPGERIIAEGVQKVGPGAKVAPAKGGAATNNPAKRS